MDTSKLDTSAEERKTILTGGEVAAQVQDDVNSWLRTQYGLLRLRLTGGISRILGFLLLLITVVLLVFAIFILGSIAAISAMSDCMPVWAASLIFVGVFVILVVLVVIFRRPLFFDPFVGRLSRIMFERDHRQAEDAQLRQEIENDIQTGK